MAADVRSLRSNQSPEQSVEFTGLVIFLGSWAVMFAALFFSFALYRLKVPSWPPPGFDAFPGVLPSLNTVVILASSVVYHHGQKAFQRGQRQAYVRALFWTTLLAAVFFAVQAFIWSSMWSSGHQLSTGLHSAFFYLLT